MVIARTVGIFIALAALSFVLGFFVLARLIPGSPNASSATVLPTGGVSSAESHEPDSTGSSSNTRVADVPRSTTVIHEVTAAKSPKQPTSLGPTLDPENDAPAGGAPSGVQTPRKMEEDTRNTGYSSTDDRNDISTADDSVDGPKPRTPSRTAIGAVKPKHRRHSVTTKTDRPSNSADNVGTGDEVNGNDPPEAPIEKTHRPQRASTAAADNHDTDATDQGELDRPAKSRRTDSEAPDGPLYHVRLGSFHSRDAADHEVQRARAKGFSTQVVPVTHNGRTLYRVQAGAFRERDRAEAIKQSLQDASLDASVTEQRK